MSHKIFNAIQKVKAAASQLEGAQKLKMSDDFIGEKRMVLRNKVMLLRYDIAVAQQQHAAAFSPDSDVVYKAIDLMEMGY